MVKYQWNLTDEERIELKDRHLKRRGNYRMFEALQMLLGMQTEQEAVWWRSILDRLKVPEEFRHNLVADHTIGKIWVKGKVQPLDSLRNKDSIDM